MSKMKGGLRRGRGFIYDDVGKGVSSQGFSQDRIKGVTELHLALIGGNLGNIIGAQPGVGRVPLAVMLFEQGGQIRGVPQRHDRLAHFQDAARLLRGNAADRLDGETPHLLRRIGFGEQAE